MFLERDASGQPRKLGDGAFGQVRPCAAFKPMEVEELNLQAGASSGVTISHLKDLLHCQVYLARWKCALVACKVLREEQVAAAELESFRREAEMLQAMNHPYILRLFGAVLDSHRVRLPLHAAVHQIWAH